MSDNNVLEPVIGEDGIEGSMAALKFAALEQAVDFEEQFIHPPVNHATNCVKSYWGHYLGMTDVMFEAFKAISGVTKAFYGMPTANDQLINFLNPKRQLDFLDHATRAIEPMKMVLPSRIVWKDERAELITCNADNGINDKPVVIYVAYTGRSAALADYNSKFEPERRSSLAREFINNGFGPVSIFTCTDPLKENLDHATPEYLASVHAANEHVRRMTGLAPHIVGLCQMGYFNAWNLADNPDDANTFVLAGAPFDPRKENTLSKVADSLSMTDIAAYLKLSGNRMSAKRMAKSWRLMSDPNHYAMNRHIKLFWNMLDDHFSTERDYVFKSWLDKDSVADIPGGLYKDLFSFFKFGMNAKCIADKDFSRITCPTTVMSGGKDDISPVDTCVAIFDHIKSPVKAHVHNPLVGHAGIYNSEKALTDRYDQNNWQVIMEWMKEHSKYR